MAKENFTIKMEVTMKVNGETIKWMDMVDFTMKEENSLIKVHGHKMSLMDMEKYIMIIL